jgi:hypothetical protein
VSTHTLRFDGVICEHKLPRAALGLPADWSAFSHLVFDLRTSSPQRFALWVYTADGVRRVVIQPFGQNAWRRISLPLRFLLGQNQEGSDMASASNRRSESFWVSVWGPFGPLHAVEAIGLALEYPVGSPTIELRDAHLATADEGSPFLEKTPVLDAFGQWAHGDWPGKLRSAEQLQRELAEEERSFTTFAEQGRSEMGGFLASPVLEASGFFRVAEVGGRWWFVDPQGHRFLSTGVNCIGIADQPTEDAKLRERQRVNRRLESWGFNTTSAWSQETASGTRARCALVHWPMDKATTFMGVPDVFADAFAMQIDRAAAEQCAPRRDDRQLLGYFVGNEPPWEGRESLVVDQILAGPDTATRAALRGFLGSGDSPARRVEFVVQAFERFLDLTCDAIRRHDPNHLLLGIRFAGKPAERVLRLARKFDVCSINVYEYEPTKSIDRAHRLSGRPVLIGEFHVGVPGNGLGAGLVQARDQAERAIAYRYFLEQAAAMTSFVGAHWFQWRDQPVLGRFDGENYNIGFVDVTDRPYHELVEAAKQSHARIHDVHAGTLWPFNRHPLASDAGAPSTPW